MKKIRGGGLGRREGEGDGGDGERDGYSWI